MQLKNETQHGFMAEIRIIPPWAWTLAAIGFVCAQVNLGRLGIYFNPFTTGQPDASQSWVRVLIGLLIGVVLASYVLLIGYVSRDARPRGMNPLLWILVAIFVPNGLGIILYFILRQPRRNPCPQCGNAVQTGFNFCPSCSFKLSPNCPQCQHVVSVNDVYCPYCGTSLRNQPAINPMIEPNIAG